MEVVIKEIYTSVACNRMPEIADWNEEGIICYGATNAVVVYNTNLKGTNPIKVLCHHKSKVNSVKWLRKPNAACTELLSCSADKTAAIWTVVDGVWKVTSVLTGHTDGVSCVDGLYTDNDDLLVFTASIDSTIRVWERKDGSTNHKQTISLNSGLCLALRPHRLPGGGGGGGGGPVLFCALDDHKIHVFAGDELHRVHTLVGHEDWVRGLDVMDVDSSTIMLASASQDTYIRLWRIQRHVAQPGAGISVERALFAARGQQWAARLEAVLAGHEGWVYGVQWHPPSRDNDGTATPVHRLLSSSLDKTLVVWAPDATGAWAERVRVGEVGGSGLGFYGSRFGPGGGAFLGHGYNGSFHIWELNKETRQWEPRAVCGGHFGRVEDVAWSPARCLLSVSADQTTRLHAPWTTPDGGVEWHELARPQVHGYDLTAVATLGARALATAAEEKVIRVFDAPDNFAHNYETIVGEPLGGEDAGAEGASVPSLGLSNKAVLAGAADDDGYFVPVNLTEPPTEETLMQNTLWPERHKLYGHGYEVFALAASPDGALLASACKASVAEHAAVRVWETQSWQEIQTLVSHQLTVTQLAFSPDSRHLLSVSRDRRWTLYTRRQGSNSLEQAACTDNTNGVHTRIIWCCAWAQDSRVFGTGSREGKVCLWSKSAPTNTSLGSYALVSTLELPKESVTALAFAPAARTHTLAAVGLDSGVIRFYAFENGWTLLKELDHSAAHHLTVRRLAFRRDAARPAGGGGGGGARPAGGGGGGGARPAGGGGGGGARPAGGGGGGGARPAGGGGGGGARPAGGGGGGGARPAGGGGGGGARPAGGGGDAHARPAGGGGDAHALLLASGGADHLVRVYQLDLS